MIFLKRNDSPENCDPLDPTGKSHEWPADDPMASAFENFRKAFNEGDPALRELHWECFKQAFREDMERRRKNELRRDE